MPYLGYISAGKPSVRFAAASSQKDEKKYAFLKNEAGELLKTKDEPKKRTRNEAKTKRTMLLKTLETVESWVGRQNGDIPSFDARPLLPHSYAKFQPKRQVV